MSDFIDDILRFHGLTVVMIAVTITIFIFGESRARRSQKD